MKLAELDNLPISCKLFILVTKIADHSLQVFEKQFDSFLRELAHRVNMSDGAISKQMTKLSKHGLLDIYVNPANNRHNQIRLTDGCTRILNDCTQVLDKLVKEH